MYRIRSYFVVVVVFLLVGLGCSEDKDIGGQYVAGPVGDLYRFCFESGEECRDYQYELFLYLDTHNMPNPKYSYPFIIMKGGGSTGGLNGSVGFDYYEFNALPENIELPPIGSSGWKVHVPEANIQYCIGCSTDGGEVKLVSLFGPRDLVEFVWDPADTMKVYVIRIP